jgi:hypothetical protein
MEDPICRQWLRLAVIALAAILAGSIPVSASQSGRSWMNGIVVDESDTNGISGAHVELIGDQASERLRAVKLSTNTDKKGNYDFQNVPYGNYTFRVTATGFVPYEIKVYILSDSLTELHVQLKRKR